MEREKKMSYWVEGVMFIIIIMLLVVLSNSKNQVAVSNKNELAMTMISGTEYVGGDVGQIVVELRNRTFDAITDAQCNATILYHNKSAFVQDGQMELSSLGTYYYNFTVPNIAGVYEYNTKCVRNGNKYVVGKSFHVTEMELGAWVTQ
jgi:hypothetical protein